MAVALILATTAFARPADATRQQHVVRTTTRVFDPRGQQPNIIIDLYKDYPDMVVKPFEGIVIQNTGGANPGRSMAMAANDGPDLFNGDVRQSHAQGLTHPLAEFIGRDGILADGTPKRRSDGTPDLNGRVDADEARWDGWMKLSPVVRQASTVDGIPHAIPRGQGTYVGILYSERLLREAGLDPLQPPESHEAFVRWCRKLYNREDRVPAVAFTTGVWAFWPWVASSGGSVNLQDRTSPTTGNVHTFHEQAIDLIAPDTGEDLAGAPVVWRCGIAAEDSLKALDLYHRLCWAPWIMDPQTGEPLELTAQQVQDGKVLVDGRSVTFNSDQVIVGSVHPITGLSGLYEYVKNIGRTIAMMPLWASSLDEFIKLGIDPTDMGMLAFPPITPEYKPVLQFSTEYAMLGKDVANRGGETEAQRQRYREFVWKLLYTVASQQGQDHAIREKVAAGQARFINPRDLRRLGFEDYIKELSPASRKLWDDVEAGRVHVTHEPFMGNAAVFGGYFDREVLGRLMSSSGRDFDYREAARRLEQDANSGVMFELPREVLDAYRPRARIIATVVGSAMLVMLTVLIRSQLRKQPSLSGVSKRWIPWLMLLPALASIGLWRYYPLLRGLVMAFQDYQIGGRQPFVGLDNFIRIFLDPNFYHYLLTTGRFVLWSLLLAFFTPILLAILLSEVPRFKMFFRTLFFLPQMTSGLVVTLMWKEMFIGNATGLINRVGLALFGWAGFEPIDWLGNPATVMACVIIPGIWAGAGAASLIYLAALKSVPEELYEAACLDGCGIRRKMFYITLPTLLPLIMINFVGSFIGTFQGMGSIFLLTFGGPGKETMVMAMAIWQEAYVNLRFSIATSYAWILGSILIGFTYLQLRILRRVDFRRAKGE